MARCAARNADSVECHFARDVSRVFRIPSFFIHAACITSSFDVSYASTISAIMSWTNWYLPIGCPKVSRSRAYSTDFSRHARITPQAPAATVNRPWSSPYIAISKPCPSSPTRFSAGTSTFSKKSSPVDPAQMPSLFSVSAVVKPGMPRSSMNAEIPLCFAPGSVFANTSAWSATFAYEIQFFEPLTMKRSPSRRAVVFIAATSEPAAGSVSPKQASFSPRACGTSQRCFCSSVAKRRRASELRPTWTEISVLNAASPRSISSQASASAPKSRPAPPYSSGITMPSRPSSAIPSITDISRRCAMSFSIALGSTRSLTNVLTVSWMSRCSSVSSKSTGQVYGRARALGPFLLPLALVGGVALDNGGFDATAWGWSTLLPLVIVGTALVLGRARSPHGLARAFLGLLGAFTAWTWLSAAWSNDVSASVLDAERLLLYLAAVAAFLLLERSQVTRFLAGLLASVSLVAVWALSLRAFGGPGSYDVASVSADATRRLAAPLGYSNALGLIAAIGIVLALGLAVRLRRPFAAAPVLVLAPTLYFTYSRGAWLALAAGGIAALGLATPRMSRRAMVAVAIVVICAGAIALVRVGGPSGAVRQFSHAAPSVKADRSRRLFSLSGSSRAQYWHVAWRDYEGHPWLGS